jgi:viroplasmin and RNaseH domain-containing protein
MGEGDKQRTKKNFYAVSAGRRTGIYTKWSMCHQQVNQFSGECYAGFETLRECVEFLVDKRAHLTPADITVNDNGTSMSLTKFEKQLQHIVTDNATQSVNTRGCPVYHIAAHSDMGQCRNT